MAKTSFSGERACESGEVILTVSGEPLADAVPGCGNTTGRDTGKAAKFGIELVEVEGSGIKIPAHSKVAIVCSLKEWHEAGGHYLYICDVREVLGSEAEKALFAWGGYSQIKAAE